MKIEIELTDNQVRALEFMREKRKGDIPATLEDVAVDLIDKVCKDVYVYMDTKKLSTIYVEDIKKSL